MAHPGPLSRRFAAAAPAVMVVAACRPDRTPIGPPARNSILADVPVRGHLALVDRVEGPSRRGELIAVSDEGLWLWTGPTAIGGATGAPKRIRRRWRDDSEGHTFVPAREIRRVVVSRYHAIPALAATGGWTGGLMLLTLSHGVFFIFTMPITARAQWSASTCSQRPTSTAAWATKRQPCPFG